MSTHNARFHDAARAVLASPTIERMRLAGLKEAEAIAAKSVDYFTASVGDHEDDDAGTRAQLAASLRTARDIRWAIQNAMEKYEERADAP